MFERMMLSVVIAAALLMGIVGCGTTRMPDPSGRQQQEEARPKSIEGIHYTTIVFDKGKSSLPAMSRDDLMQLVKKAQRQKFPIEEIRILAWSDTEYPDKLTGATSKEDVEMASKRALKIKDFLKTKLNDANEIDSFNMAKRPDLLSKVLRNDEYKVKEAFESSGATASKLPDGSVSYTKASKVIVIIDYEGQ